MAEADREANRFTGRVRRYAQVGTGLGGVAAKLASARLFGGGEDFDARTAKEITDALGGLKGPLMKVAQMLATIPDAVPPEYAEELATLQSSAPPMGWLFVKRRMTAELGLGWEKRFRSFEHQPAAAASLGQVHRAVAADGTPLAVKLQYPDMDSAMEADLAQFAVLLSLHRKFRPAIDTRDVEVEIGARLREELDYRREARHAALYRAVLAGEAGIRVPDIWPELSTRRLLTMTWLDGRPLLAFKGRSLDERNLLADCLFRAWWHPFAHAGVIHGDPHLGNYTVATERNTEDGAVTGINLLDYGCIRIFPPAFVAGVVALYRALQANDRAGIVAAFERWGFQGLTKELVDVLEIWARFIYGPLLDDRVRTIADTVAPGQYGRREAFKVHSELKRLGPVRVPRPFVFMDRAAIGLGSVFLHLSAEMNFHQRFEAAIDGFDVDALTRKQAAALADAGLEPDAA